MFGFECTEEGSCEQIPGMSCSQIYECVMECGGLWWGPCIDQCRAQGSPIGQQLFDELEDCVMQVCMFFPSPDCWQEAVEGQCQEVFFLCMEDVCEPDCFGKECGGDGCGGSCGTCPDGQECDQGQCQPLPSKDCEEIYLCAEACGFTAECIDECKAQG